MEQTLSVGALAPFPPALHAQVDALLNAALAADHHKIVVLDDDPTGVQTVHGVTVFTQWDEKSLDAGFSAEERLFFVLTNSRSFTPEHTARVHRAIAVRTLAAAKKAGRDFFFISRGDSTLRGHYPLETQVLREELEQGLGAVIDGEILCPYFSQGGRYTLDDVHYVRMGDSLVPAAQTEFAQDKSFGYTQSNLCRYIEEKTGGAYRAEAVTSIALEDLRAVNVEKITAQLLAVQNFGKVVVNATDDYDVKVFCVALYRAMAQGKRFCLRTAAALVKEAGGVAARPLLRRAEMVTQHTGHGGIVVVGSHTQKTTAQLGALLTLEGVQPLELDSDLVLTPGALVAETARVTEACNALIAAGKTPVVYTKRTLLSLPADTPESALARSVEISNAVQAVVAGLTAAPSFVVAKGGITSSDVGVKALGVRCALVLGQICPGVPVWKTGPESRFPGTPYIIFPGNVGAETTLREAVAVLLAENTIEKAGETP